jgi:hypothetical protein
MQQEPSAAQVRNDRIEFVTTAPPSSPFATLERRVVVTGPQEVVALAQSGDPRVLDALVPLLSDPHRAWAAEVVLAAMTGEEAKLVDSFAAQPAAWWDALGSTAQSRWQSWLDERRARLVWDAEDQIFVEAQ